RSRKIFQHRTFRLRTASWLRCARNSKERIMLKSRPDRYGAVAVSIHWISAILILALLGSGFQAANAPDSIAKGAFLRAHIPMAIAILLLTLFRIVWWWLFDRKPLPVQGSPAWQEWLARAVHVAFYIVILGMVASGVGMM